MSSIDSVCMAVDFVEDNLREPITVADMAEAVSYSLYYFCRTFGSVTHHTPYDYLMRRRLSESARELLETERRIIDIALDYRFNSPETYSRAFKRMFGRQPNACRKRGWIDHRFLMSRLTAGHIEHVNRGGYLKPVLVERDLVRLAGVMTVVDDSCRIESGLWTILSRELARAGGEDYAAQRYGVTWYPEGRSEQRLLYLAGVELGSVDAIASGLVWRDLPSGSYAKFVHKGARSQLRLTLDYVYQTWLPKSGETLSCPLQVELFGPHVELGGEEAEWELLIPLA